MTTQDKVNERTRRVAVNPRNSWAMIDGMGAPKGRGRRATDGERTLFANVGGDVIDRLDAGAAAVNMSRAGYLERLIREMPVDERELPLWLAELVDVEQLPLTQREDPKRAA
jgi:hypothetical protein